MKHVFCMLHLFGTLNFSPVLLSIRSCHQCPMSFALLSPPSSSTSLPDLPPALSAIALTIFLEIKLSSPAKLQSPPDDSHNNSLQHGRSDKWCRAVVRGDRSHCDCDAGGVGCVLCAATVHAQDTNSEGDKEKGSRVSKVGLHPGVSPAASARGGSYCKRSSSNCNMWSWHRGQKMATYGAADPRAPAQQRQFEPRGPSSYDLIQTNTGKIEKTTW